MFVLSEFAIESIIRQGLNKIKDSNIDMRLTDIFGHLREDYMVAKYGSTEIDKIKLFIQRSQINVVHSLSQLNNQNLPSFSIHLLSDSEEESKAGFGDYSEESATPIDPEVIVPTFNASAYSSTTGRITVPDSVNLSRVYQNRWYVDGIGQEFQILLPISNVTGDKYFTIAPDQIGIILTNSTIVSAVSMSIYDVHYIPTNEQIMIGVHSENALLTKYLYYVLRYILYSSKDSFKQYNMLLSKFNGSDFSLQQTLLPEAMFSRFITAQFITYNTWRNDELQVIDAINPYGGLLCVSGYFAPTSYDATTGIVSVPDTADLSTVEEGYVFTDVEGARFEVLGDISDVTGAKSFRIKAGQSFNMTTGACVNQPYKLQTEAESEREDKVDYDWDTKVEEE